MRTITLTRRDDFYNLVYSMLGTLEKNGYCVDDKTF